ncbi:MAG: FlgD immunoglobulin-like domain containing protein, partial [Akkermansiaceae bacterium]
MVSCFGALLAFRSSAACASSSTITLELPSARKLSMGIYESTSGRLLRTLLRSDHLEAGTHEILWDGLDDFGNPVPDGSYEWRSISAPGFKARYLTTIGVNPPGGAKETPNQSWVGDHNGVGLVDVDESGVYVGAPITEGGRMAMKLDSAMSKVEWGRPQFYQGGRLTRLATSGRHLFLIHPTGKLRRLNSSTGEVEKEWDVRWEDTHPVDLDASGDHLVLVYQEKNTLRWLSAKDGRVLDEQLLDNPVRACLLGADASTLVASGNTIFQTVPGTMPKKKADLNGQIVAMDYDPTRKELWVVLNRYQIVRLDQQFKAVQTYGKAPRPDGTFRPEKFNGLHDIAADLKGGCYVAEPTHAPRRLVHLGRDGSIKGQWFGGMSFYVHGCFDPEDPSLLYGIAPEGSVNV